MDMSLFKSREVKRLTKYTKRVTQQDYHDFRLVEIDGKPFYVEQNMVGEEMDFIELYVISNDNEIKEGDWFIDLRAYHPNQPEEYDSKTSGKLHDRCKKIIATTDKSLRVINSYQFEDNFETVRNYLPEPSQGFIKKYCEKGGIDEVMVEYEESFTKTNCSNCNGRGYLEVEEFIQPRCSYCNRDGKSIESILVPKISSDNTITIKPVKDNYSREEVIEKLREFAYSGYSKEQVLGWAKRNV